jgi:hypothetical protein
MRFFDRFTKRKTYFDTASRLLLSLATSGTEQFLEIDLPEIAKCFNIDLDDFDINILRGETIILCLWAATKALENDNSELIKDMQSKAFAAIGNDRRSQFQQQFSYRCDTYNNAWDESSQGNQSVLAHHILTALFGEGQYFDCIALFHIIGFVLIVMKSVLEMRAKIRLTA